MILHELRSEDLIDFISLWGDRRFKDIFLRVIADEEQMEFDRFVEKRGEDSEIRGKILGLRRLATLKESAVEELESRRSGLETENT